MSPNDENSRMDWTVHIINAFTKNGTGGNPAGVILDADSLTECDMQAIATQVGLSESAFVSRSATGGAKLDFFTPNRRIAHCGHATVAAFSLMHALGRVGEGVTSKETVDGPRRIVVADGSIFMEQLAPKYHTVTNWRPHGVGLPQVLHSLGLRAEQLDPRFSPHVVNTGNSFLLVGVRRGADLANLVPDHGAIARVSEKLDLLGYYVFTTDRAATSEDATCRMFAPRFGITEESATGMAAGPLACVFHDFLGARRHKFSIEQGAFMRPASPSVITVSLATQAGRIMGLMAGGRAKVSEVLTVSIPSVAQAGGVAVC